jgi:hypothetical protein
MTVISSILIYDEASMHASVRFYGEALRIEIAWIRSNSAALIVKKYLNAHPITTSNP